MTQDITVTFSGMREEDLEQVARIEEACFSQPWSIEGFRTSLLSGNTIYLCARSGERVIGYAGLLRTFEEADITNIAVDPAYRGGGIGTGLIRTLMEKGRKEGIQRFTLEVRVGNTAAIRLYEKEGFHSVGIRKRFYSFPAEDACIMWTDEPEEVRLKI